MIGVNPSTTTDPGNLASTCPTLTAQPMSVKVSVFYLDSISNLFSQVSHSVHFFIFLYSGKIHHTYPLHFYSRSSGTSALHLLV